MASVTIHRLDPNKREPQAPTRADHLRLCVGWALFVSVMTVVSAADPNMPSDGIPWTAAWIFYLPSLIAIFKSFRDPGTQDRTHQGTIIHAVLGITALLFIAAVIVANPIATTIDGCTPGLSGTWIGGGYCPNVFEHRWGVVGKAVPVAFGVILTSFVHMIIMSFKLARKNVR